MAAGTFQSASNDDYYEYVDSDDCNLDEANGNYQNNHWNEEEAIQMGSINSFAFGIGTDTIVDDVRALYDLYLFPNGRQSGYYEYDKNLFYQFYDFLKLFLFYLSS